MAIAPRHAFCRWFANAKAHSHQRRRSEDHDATHVQQQGACVDRLAPSDGFGHSGEEFSASSGFEHPAPAAAFGDAVGQFDDFSPGAGAFVSAAADMLAPFRGKSLKVKRSSGAIESGWQLVAGAQVDAHGMVELAMGELSRGMTVEELFQLNADLALPAAPSVPSGFEVANPAFGPDDGFGPSDNFAVSSALALPAAPAVPSGFEVANPAFGPDDEFGPSDNFAVSSALPVVVPQVMDSSSDILFPFRNKPLNVKRSSGAIEGGWFLSEDASLDIHGMIDVVKGELLRSVPFKELQTLNSEILRVARGELTPEEILAGMSMGQDVFRS